MAGTIEGGRKTVQTIKQRYGSDYYKEMGRVGGMKSKGGFTARPERAKEAGSKGGKLSKRGYKLISKTDTKLIYEKDLTHEILEVDR